MLCDLKKCVGLMKVSIRWHAPVRVHILYYFLEIMTEAERGENERLLTRVAYLGTDRIILFSIEVPLPLEVLVLLVLSCHLSSQSVLFFVTSLPMWLPSLVFAVLLLLHQGTATLANIPNSLSSWLDTHPIPTKIATNAIKSTNRTLSSAAIRSQRSRCPARCGEAGLNPNNWTVYHDLSRLQVCNQTMLLDFNLHNSLDDPTTPISVRACGNPASSTSNVESAASKTCPSRGNRTEVQESIQIAFNHTGNSGSLVDFTAASQQLKQYLTQQGPSCNSTIAFAYSESATVGFFAGTGTQNISGSVFENFITEVQTIGISESVLIQLCAPPGQNRSSKYTMGIIANSNADVGFVQIAVQTWASGKCVTAYDSSKIWQNVTLLMPSLQPNSTSLTPNATLTNSTMSRRALAPRASATCTTVQVASGDSCKWFLGNHENRY